MAIVYFFHVLVDGWLTKLSAPIVIYDEGQITGVRVPWDIPVEDYLFGFSMITLTLMLWVRLGDRDDRGPDRTAAHRPHDDAGGTVTDAPHREEWVLADAFDRAAPTYDAMVALSPGYHDQLRTAAEALVDRLPAPGAGDGALRVLDLGCGSGASTRALLDAWSAQRRARPTTCRSPGSTPPRAWSAQARAKPGPRASPWSSPTPSPTSSRCRAARSTASWRPTCCATCPTAPGWSREVARVLRPGGGVRHPRLLGGRQHPRQGDLGRRVPRHHHPAGRGEAVRRAAAPLPLHERARLRLGRPHLRAAAVRPASST